MSSDPHDQLLLTERPTTIVTQHTASMDSMPTPYGTQEDEEAMFSDVGSDEGMARNAMAVARSANGTEDRIATVAYDDDGLAASDPRVLAQKAAAASASTMSLVILALVGLGVGFALSRK
jgi:hypothetical protein